MKETPPSRPPRRFSRRSRLIAILLAAATLFATGAITRSASAGTMPKYSDDDLVSGLIYGIGPVADQYPKLALGSGRIVDREASTAFLPRLYAETERRAPGFRARFANAVYSGDRLRVKQTTVDTIKLLGDAFVTLVPELEPLLRRYNSDSSGQATWYYENDAVWADAYVVIEAAVAVALAGVATVVLSVIDFTPVLAAPTSPDAASLQLEIWADSVASTLGPR